MDDLEQRIEKLPDDAAMEAVNLLAGDVLEAKPDDEVAGEVGAALGVPDTGLQDTLDSAPPGATAELARLALVEYATRGDRAEVERAIDAAGEKAFLLEAGVIGLLALGLIHTVMTRGAKETTVESKVSIAGNGTVTVERRETRKNYSVGTALAPFAAKLLGAITP